jgi:hypothetical protein
LIVELRNFAINFTQDSFGVGVRSCYPAPDPEQAGQFGHKALDLEGAVASHLSSIGWPPRLMPQANNNKNSRRVTMKRSTAPTPGATSLRGGRPMSQGWWLC